MQEFDGTFELVPPDQIHFDRKYQRDQHWPLIGAIGQNPIWVAFGVVICAKRLYAEGLLYALDGQQRLNGVMTAEHPPALVPVFWWPVKTVVEEAALFDTINTNRKAVAALQRFKARVTAENPTYVRIAKAVERAGYTIGANAESTTTIAGVSGLQAIYNNVSEEAVYIGLVSYREAWPDDNAPTSTMLVGLADVMADMSSNGGLSAEKLSKALARTTPGRVMRRAEEIRHRQGGSKRAAVREAFKVLAKV